MSVRKCAECGSVVPPGASLCPVCAAPFAPVESGEFALAGQDEPTAADGDVAVPAWPGDYEPVVSVDPEPVQSFAPVDADPDADVDTEPYGGPVLDSGPGRDEPGMRSPGPSRQAFVRAMLVAAAVTAVVAIGAGGVLWATRDDGADAPVVAGPTGRTPPGETGDPGAPATPSSDPASTDPASADPTELTPSPSESPAVVGLVTIETDVPDERATAVAGTFDTYFSAVNDRDFPSAAAMFDPAGDVLDPADEQAVQRFGRQLVTTRDSEVVLRSLTDAGPGVVAAVVTFRSTQDPGYGPKSRPQETCTLWQVRYELSTTASGAYRILRSKSAVPSRPCPA
ncbi:zinc ribbon domain-containing protein [Micromonospora chalcea]|uniref:zinc ribbon domain-containing protein n=1 Tax=Micromonospora chalcea TaxID=1874 RepID=UPI00157DE20A|nr:zinc ribbon domain-containing protein [Micromonospora chalcea]